MAENPTGRTDCTDWMARALGDWPVVTAFARQFTRDSATAEDLAQDAYLRLIANAGSIDVGRPLRALLLTTVRRLWIDRARRKDALALAEDSEPQDGDASPLERLEARDESERVAAALAELPRSWAAALFLADGLDQPSAEIAGILGTSPEVVRVTLHRARRRLRERLQPVHSEGLDERDRR